MSELVKIFLLDDRGVIFEAADANTLWNKGCFGELRENKLQLSLIECVFLSEIKKAQVYDKNNKKISTEKIYKYAANLYDDFVPRYNVYKDLKSRGYIVKTGFKFGAHFRLYERGKRPGEGHADFLVHVIPEDHTFELQELSRSVRLSGSVKKKIWYAIVDSEGDITYYQIVRIKP